MASTKERLWKKHGDWHDLTYVCKSKTVYYLGTQ